MAVRAETVQALRAAMQRLLNGTPLHTDGDLTWANVYREAGVPRATANRAKDLIAEWQEKLGERAEDPAAIKTVVEKVRDLQQELNEKSRKDAESSRALRRTIEVMANHIQALTLALRKAEKDASVLRGEVSRLQADLAQAHGAQNVTDFPYGR